MSETVEDARAGSDADVVGALVENHRQFLQFLERRVGDRALAEDILQEAFVRGVERGAQLRESESAVAWFYRMLRNSVVDHYRRRGASARAVEKLAREMEGEEAPDQATSDTICKCIGRLAQTLKPEYAHAIQRVEVEGASLQQLADEAGISANNAAVRVHRAREALKKRVHASCGTCASHGCLNCTCGQPSGGCA